MVEVSDWRALSLLETEQPTLMEIVGGIAFTIAAFVGLPALALLSALVFGEMESLFGAGVDDLPPPSIEVIETRFVRLGKRKEPRRLPSKEIPDAQQTAPVPQAPESEPMAAVPTGKQEKGLAKPNKQRNQRDEDLLSQLGERAGAISDLTKGPELEGDPDGIVEGTKATGDELEIYLGKLYSYFRRGWQVPTQISDEELQKLACVIELSIMKDGRVGGYEVTRPSGNEAFDESVRRRMSQAEGADLPGPPESIANRVFGETISLRFFGRHAR
ncbi:MAG: TonB C-terminal domain-containing protein [Myxococcales bacterium]|nr:MAG: TonB C-terminal domain-containing protein [Myxococcales bacterium]